MGTIECSQPASKSSWDNQDFGDISMVLWMTHFRKSTGPRWVKYPRDGMLFKGWAVIVDSLTIIQLFKNYM